ncbi:carbohydrate sulfotransferase 10-like [Lytechinus pictus]|uniref:carbohydrate sulfotransferase 10-like n=1 Tax=Lytechinus pictus TaxID=7653 RepID=UPI0030B9E98C
MVEFMSTHWEINRLRRELILQKCAKYPELNGSTPISDNTFHHIYVSDKYKLLYCFIPKVGCSNWKRVMMILNGSNKSMSEMYSGEVHEHNNMTRLMSFPPDARQHRLNTFTTFMYVRNPFVRVLSAYKNKFVNIAQYRSSKFFQDIARRIMKQMRPKATSRERRTGENITWIEFVDYLTQPTRPIFDDHWEEMFKICSPCKIKYDYIGHLETIAQDAKFMIKELQLDSLVEYPSKENSHPTNSTTLFEQDFLNLPKQTIQKLWEIYKKDFEIFDYPKPDFITDF